MKTWNRRNQWNERNLRKRRSAWNGQPCPAEAAPLSPSARQCAVAATASGCDVSSEADPTQGRCERVDEPTTSWNEVDSAGVGEGDGAVRGGAMLHGLAIYLAIVAVVSLLVVGLEVYRHWLEDRGL